MKVLASLSSYPSSTRFHDVKFFKLNPEHDNEVIMIACEDGRTRIYVLQKGENKDNEGNIEQPELMEARLVGCLIGHRNRVKAMETSYITNPLSDGSIIPLITTISSDGLINLFDLSPIRDLLQKEDGNQEEEALDLTPVGVYDTKGMRLVCLSVQGLEENSDGAVVTESESADENGEDEESNSAVSEVENESEVEVEEEEE
jgi:protein MAK11